MLISQNERDLDEIQIFPKLSKAQRTMKIALLQQLGGSFDDYDEGEDYGLNKTSAWSNPGSNWDWTIVRISVNTANSLKVDAIGAKKVGVKNGT
jgi:hypothetical protein